MYIRTYIRCHKNAWKPSSSELGTHRTPSEERMEEGRQPVDVCGQMWDIVQSSLMDNTFLCGWLSAVIVPGVLSNRPHVVFLLWRLDGNQVLAPGFVPFN